MPQVTVKINGRSYTLAQRRDFPLRGRCVLGLDAAPVDSRFQLIESGGEPLHG